MIDRPTEHAGDVETSQGDASSPSGDVPAFPPPSPPDAPTTPAGDSWRTAPRAGVLTPAWRWTLALAWIGVFVGMSAVWKTSRELGLPTWWLGPLPQPRPILIMLSPFVAPTLVVLLVFNRVTWAPWAAIGGGVVTALIAIGDLQPYPRLGFVELALAAAGTAVGIASFGGRYRADPDRDDAAT